MLRLGHYAGSCDERNYRLSQHCGVSLLSLQRNGCTNTIVVLEESEELIEEFKDKINQLTQELCYHKEKRGSSP